MGLVVGCMLTTGSSLVLMAMKSVERKCPVLPVLAMSGVRGPIGGQVNNNWSLVWLFDFTSTIGSCRSYLLAILAAPGRFS